MRTSCSLSDRSYFRHLNRWGRGELHFGYRLLIPIEARRAAEGSALVEFWGSMPSLYSVGHHFEPKVESFVMPSNLTQQIGAQRVLAGRSATVQPALPIACRHRAYDN
jgi:hypothetical protein